MILYKYFAVNKHSISCLVNNCIWSSSPNNFNDPYDTAIIDNDFLRSINFDNEKILCLTANNKNFLMWAHYADSHKGFCVEYTDYTDEEIEQLKADGIYPQDAPNNNLSIIRNAKAVQYKSTEEINNYVKDFPLDENGLLSYFEDYKKNGKEKELIDLIHKSSFIKHSDWAYEEEYRLINTKKNIGHSPGKITAVYFGTKMNSLDKRCIGLILNPNLDNSCKLYQMYREKGTYNLKARKFDPRTDLNGLEITYKKR